VNLKPRLRQNTTLTNYAVWMGLFIIATIGTTVAKYYAYFGLLWAFFLVSFV
jgi:hypothetical protein